MSEKNKALINQIIRFGVVGISNTIVSYVIYAVAFALTDNYFLANVLSWLLSVLHAYIWQNVFVFKEDKKSWEDKHNFYNSFSSVDPTQYDHESDYLDDLRIKWKEYYDPTEMYDVDPHDYDNEGDYMDAIQNYIKMKMRE